MNDARMLGLALIVGCMVEMPVGPVATLCIRQAIVIGPIAGLATALAPAIADSLYGALGIVGSRGPLLLLAPYHTAIHIGLGILLCTLAVYFGRSALQPQVTEPVAASAFARGFAPALVLSISNPAALIVAATLFTSFGAGTVRASQYPYVALAMFAGAMLWWSVVAAIVSRVRKYATSTILRALYAFCALVFLAVGITSFVSAR